MANTRKALDQLFVSRVRVKLLHYFFTHPDVPVHLRGAVRELKEEINAVRRELNRMEEVKILKVDVHGNRKYFSLKKDAPFIDELRGMVLKSFGLGGLISRNLTQLGEITYAILSSTFYNQRNNQGQEVDLVLIGEVNLEELNKLVAEYELKEQREVNYTVIKLNDFELRKKRRDSFITDLLLTPKVMLLGTQEQLIS